MPENSTEACLSVWLVLDKDTGLVSRVHGRAYVLRCSDREKGEVLKTLASADFHLAQELKVMSGYRSHIVSESGRERSLNGLSPADVNLMLPDILDRVCKELEGDFPERSVVNAVDNPRSFKMKFSTAPYYVLTYLIKNAHGELVAHEG